MILALLLSTSLAQAGAPTIDELIAQLGSDAIETREKAQAAIQARWKSWSAADLAALEKAAIAGGEVAVRARVAHRRVQFARSLPDETHAAFPDAVSITCGGAPEKVSELIRRIGERIESGETGLKARSVAVILAELLDDDRDSDSPNDQGEPQTLGELAYQWLSVSIPALRDLKSREKARAWWLENKNKPEREWHLPMLDHKDEYLRSNALIELAALNEPGLYPRIFETLKSFTDEGALMSALQSLSPIPESARAPALKAFLRDPRPRIRLETAKLLFNALKNGSIDAVMETIDQGDPLSALHWLARCREERAFAFVLKCLESGSLDVKMGAIYALTLADDPRVERALVRAFDDPERKSHLTGAMRQPRVCDSAGFALTQRWKKEDDYSWPDSHRDRDRNLEKLRNDWRMTQGLPPIPFLGPGVKAVDPKSVALLVPDLIHDDPERRRSATRNLVQLGPGAWTPLREEIAKSTPAARARLEEAGRACSNALRKVTVKSKDAEPFGELLKKRLYEPFEFDRLVKEVVETWFNDDVCCVLRLAVSRGQDGRGVSIDIDVRRRPGTWGSIGTVSTGRCSRLTWSRDALVRMVEKEFAPLKAAMESADEHAEVDVVFEKLNTPRE